MTPQTVKGAARLSWLIALIAGGLVLGIGVVCQWVVIAPLLEGFDTSTALARELALLISLVFGGGALLMAGGALLASYLINRPMHELATSIALSGMAEVPVPVPSAGSPAVQLVARRYNDLVKAVADTNRLLRESAEFERDRAEAVANFSDLVVAGVPSGIVATDADGVVVRANAAAHRILELSEDALEGNPLRDVLGHDHPVALATSAPADRAEVALCGPPERVLGISSGAIHDAVGDVVGHVAIFAELTELRRLEQQLELQGRLASLGEVAAGLAHEIRNPLGALRGFVELLERRLDDPTRARPLLGKIVREADALSSVVGDFLAFARPAPPRRQPVVVAPLLAEIVEAGSAAMGGAVGRTVVESDPPDLEVDVDVAQVRRALLNFVINAAQAAGPEGTTWVRARQEGHQVLLSVQDDGPGIPPELLGELPRPFLTTKPGGTGLGLAVVHQIAQAHGGELRCESPAAGGARFVLVLPRRSPER